MDLTLNRHPNRDINSVKGRSYVGEQERHARAINCSELETKVNKNLELKLKLMLNLAHITFMREMA